MAAPGPQGALCASTQRLCLGRGLSSCLWICGCPRPSERAACLYSTALLRDTGSFCCRGQYLGSTICMFTNSAEAGLCFNSGFAVSNGREGNFLQCRHGRLYHRSFKAHGSLPFLPLLALSPPCCPSSLC